MSIQLITFDLDDTLWDVAPAIETAEVVLREWLANHAPRLGELSFEDYWTIRSALLAEEPGLKHRISELRRRALTHAMREAGYATSQAQTLAEAAFEAFLEARNRVQLFSDALPTLQALSQQFQLGVITNGNADVRRIGIDAYFQFALSAEELGIGKPDPIPFNEALKRSGSKAELSVHIGDHPIDDIAGAQGAGLRAIWFNPQGKIWDAEHRPDAEIRSLAQLPALLQSWR
ncbi:HAD family hydrolase [Pseudomonas sp. TTU2014-080ASC]|uniref:HAD family hydrolase n=1 Tax=Pseudomonas sp. TTU2014-080ASC TaxID=1729724 RepID=UPI0007183FCD|nr:HAD-IA family hydrolase [Pseudomonas sp. TTU2014-080ASC]KRW61342.1 HAD family hydrolase [Pseudomonas sp. TTU2014-080ASC]